MTFSTFLSELLDFESGWDRDRYDSGNIIDAQLDSWARGKAGDFYPGKTSWGQLTEAEWSEMAYRSMNTLGFVGYQFGEALLIDLGYYKDDQFYGNGASTNTWDGTWTGKNGVNSLEDFMTKGAQDKAIQEAFGFKLKIIRDGLAQNGIDLESLLGTERSFNDGGTEKTVTLTLTGILAAAHLRGAYGTLDLLRAGNVSSDEFGTSILKYMEQFGGYDAPSVDALIETTGGGESPTTPPDASQDDADYVLDWSWGKNEVASNFDTTKDTIFVGWFSSDAVQITQNGDDVVLKITSNDQSLTLKDVKLSALSPANFLVLDDELRTKISQAIGEDGSRPVTDPSPDPTPDPKPDIDPDPTGTQKVVTIDWAWGRHDTVQNFDTQTGKINIGWFNSDQIKMTEENGSVVITIPSNNQKTVLDGIKLSNLTLQNFTIKDDSVLAEFAQQIDVGTLTMPTHGGGGHLGGTMTMITTKSASRDIRDFDPSKDMLHIEQDVTGAAFEISQDVAGGISTISVAVSDVYGGLNSTTRLVGTALEDLTLANFSIADQSVLNEVTSAIGATIDPVAPTATGYRVQYDSDGSTPAIATANSGGKTYTPDFNADDITGFNVATDQVDIGGTSIHGMIITKTPNGEVVIDSPWSSAMQIVTGVQISDMTMKNFGIVGNEHFREDLGGVMSWELGVGPRDPNTVYVRSHEYGKAEIVSDFDIKTDKISILYFGTRERLSVSDTEAGLVISTLPTGQSVTLTGVKLADLPPGQVEFHFDQVMEDNLEVPFGFSQEDVALVSRKPLLTPQAPSGEYTDGDQVRDGKFSNDASDVLTFSETAPSDDAPSEIAPEHFDHWADIGIA